MEQQNEFALKKLQLKSDLAKLKEDEKAEARKEKHQFQMEKEKKK